MADIRNYLKEKQKREANKSDYKEKIRKHRLTNVYRVILVLAAVCVLAAIAYVQFKNHIYTDYEVMSSVSFESAGSSKSIRLGSNILTYSNDGAHCTNSTGTVLWNQTFEMQDIILAMSGDVVAIGDYNGREIYILNSMEKLGEVNTTMPIRSIAVSETGRVAVAVADTKTTWIYIYRTDGTQEYEIKTTMNQSGYPVAFSLSPNGELLGMSCIYVDSGVLKSRVAFYNFGSVGENKSDYLVNAYTYSDCIISHIKFLNGKTAVAVGDDRLLFYSGTQIPELQAQYLFEDEVQGVYTGESYVGLLFRSDKPDQKNEITIYGTDSEIVGTYYFNTDFTDIFFGQDIFVAYNSTECLISTFDGLEKYNGTFDKSVCLMIPAGRGTTYKFIVVTNDSIDTIQLK